MILQINTISQEVKAIFHGVTVWGVDTTERRYDTLDLDL